jgi:lipoyl(octanoyl) transferase
MLHLLPTDTRDGPANLAADDVLLDHAAAGRLSLRFYTWNRPTVSLGYFQPGLPWVRRATGGHLILHGDADLTYSLAVPAGVPLPGGETVWPCAVHRRIAAVLKGWGVPARLVVCGEEKTLGPVLCFERHTPGDVVVNGAKVVGTAQRKRRGAVLQHGTIRLAASRLLPQLPGVAEAAGVTIDPDRLAAAVADDLARTLGSPIAPTAWTADDETRIAAAAAQYAAAEWNEKR